MFNQIMQGNSFEYLTKIMEIVIEKYDRFVKDLHISFVSYVETLYDNMVSLNQNFKRNRKLFWNFSRY